MKWALIFIVFSSNSVTSHAVYNIDGAAACKLAGKELKEQAEAGSTVYKRVEFTCAPMAAQ